MSALNYNINDMPDGGGDFEPIPAGNYTVTITEAEVKDTKAGTGQYIKLRLDVMGPTHQGRVLFSNINHRNPNPKAEEIGKAQLGSIMRAINIIDLTDTDQLVGGNMEVKVTVKDDPTYGKGNEVKAYKAISGSAAPMATNAAPSADNASKPPWAK